MQKTTTSALYGYETKTKKTPFSYLLNTIKIMNETLHLKITASEKQRLEQEAREYSLPLSSYVRLKLKGYFQNTQN